ncbi:polysaccharide biosynthesis tyrosine autokinase [Nakamurella silvestris]|nr:polysaccharide biosynthesis tyrosine autokinase [Nakamurella silvestris]
MELSEFLLILRVRWKALLLSILLCAMAAAGWTLSQTPVYSADATGFIKTGGDLNPNSGDVYAKSRAKSYVGLALSRATAETVINDLGLNISPSALVDEITVQAPTGTVLIQVTAKSSSASLARDLANAWIRALAIQVEQVETDKKNPEVNPVAAASLEPIESAVTPKTPISPNPQRNIAIGLLLGLGLGLGYAMLRHHLDKRMRTADSVEGQFKRPVVGTIPLDDSLTDRDRITISLSGRAPAGGHDPAIAEAFRGLRTNLRFMNVDKPPRKIVVTSPVSGDGKSTVTANLGVAIAASGEKVVIVDGDLRHPVMAGVFQMSEDAGLTDILIGRATLAEMMQPWGRNGDLHVLGAGSVPPNPNELLSSELMHSILDELAKDYIVLIDAPPLLPVSDAAALAARADGVLVVITSGRTTKDNLSRALSMLDKVDGTTLGIIMNRIPRKGPMAHQYGYYGSSYYPGSPADPVPLGRMATLLAKVGIGRDRPTTEVTDEDSSTPETVDTLPTVDDGADMPDARPSAADTARSTPVRTGKFRFKKAGGGTADPVVIPAPAADQAVATDTASDAPGSSEIDATTSAPERDTWTIAAPKSTGTPAKGTSAAPRSPVPGPAKTVQVPPTTDPAVTDDESVTSKNNGDPAGSPVARGTAKPSTTPQTSPGGASTNGHPTPPRKKKV